MNNVTNICILLLASSIMSGCGIGQKKVLFTTRSNVGLDVDAKQFTAQLNIDRQEAVIGPTFEGGQHVPITAAFRNNNKLLGGFGVSSLFAGGDAALALTTQPKANRIEGESLITLTKPPKYPRSRFGKIIDAINPFTTSEENAENLALPGPGQVKPFIFDTDTSLGIKLAWTGATAEFPDKVKIGFNREEFALAPVMATQNARVNTNEEAIKNQKLQADGLDQLAESEKSKLLVQTENFRLATELKDSLAKELELTKTLLEKDKENESLKNSVAQIENKLNIAKDHWQKSHKVAQDALVSTAASEKIATEYKRDTAYSIGIPSFFAAIDSHSGFTSIGNTDIGFRQVFAAGKSATNLANNSDIRAIIKDRFGLSDANLCLTEWLRSKANAADSRNNTDRATALQKWLEDNEFSVSTVTELTNNPFAWKDFAGKNISPGACQNIR